MVSKDARFEHLYSKLIYLQREISFRDKSMNQGTEVKMSEWRPPDDGKKITYTENSSFEGFRHVFILNFRTLIECRRGLKIISKKIENMTKLRIKNRANLKNRHRRKPQVWYVDGDISKIWNKEITQKSGVYNVL